MAFQSGSIQAQDPFTMDRFNELRNDALGMPGTPNYLTSSRAVGTASYQNLSGQNRLVLVSAQHTLTSGGTAKVNAEVSANGSDFGTVSQCRTVTVDTSASFSFPLPNTWYARVRGIEGTWSLVTWTEYTL